MSSGSALRDGAAPCPRWTAARQTLASRGIHVQREVDPAAAQVADSVEEDHRLLVGGEVVDVGDVAGGGRAGAARVLHDARGASRGTRRERRREGWMPRANATA